jgi:hypothetical protein
MHIYLVLCIYPVGRVRKKGKLREWYRYTREPIEKEAQYNTARVIDAVNADVVC